MLVNRRKSERRMCSRVAKIQFGTGSLPRDCTITDISDGGVKVIAEYVQFQLNSPSYYRRAGPDNVGWHGGSAANSALNSSTRSKSGLGISRPAGAPGPRARRRQEAWLGLSNGRNRMAGQFNQNLGLN